MNLSHQLKEDNKTVEDWLLNYPQRKARFEEIKDAELYPKTQALQDRMPIKSNRTTDPTSVLGIKLAMGELTDEEGNKVKRWFELVEEIENALSPKLRLILRLRREITDKQSRRKRNPGNQPWIPYVQRKYADEMAKNLRKDPEDTWINSTKIFTAGWKDIMVVAMYAANKRGLL